MAWVISVNLAYQKKILWTTTTLWFGLGVGGGTFCYYSFHTHTHKASGLTLGLNRLRDRAGFTEAPGSNSSH